MPVRNAGHRVLRVRVARCAGALAIVAGCSRPDPDKASGAATAPTASASTSASPAASASAQTNPAERFLNDTGFSDDRTAGSVAELWVPKVEVSALAYHAGSLWWSDGTGVHERPIGGEAREVIPARRVPLLAVDADGLYFVEDRGEAGFEIHHKPPGGEPPRRLARGSSSAHGLVLTTSHVVVASASEGIQALPKRGGPPLRFEAKSGYGAQLTADGHELCYVVNGDRVVCRSLESPGARPQEIAASDVGPLLLDGGIVFWLEGIVGSDVILSGEFGRFVRWDRRSGNRRVVVTQLFQVYELLKDDGGVYFFTDRGGLRRVLKDGSSVQMLYHLGRWEAPSLAIGGGYAFWASRRTAGIYRMRLPD